VKPKDSKREQTHKHSQLLDLRKYLSFWRTLDGQVGLDGVQGSTNTLLFREDLTTTSVEARVNSSNGVFRALNFDQVDRLLETGLGGEHAGIEATTSSGNDLTSTTVNSVGVQDDIVNVEANSTNVLIAQGSFLGGPVEGSDAGILNFVQVLDSLGNVDQQVGSVSVRTKAPDLTGIAGVPVVFVSQDLTTDLGVVARVNLS